MENPFDNPQVRQSLSADLTEYQIELLWPTGKPHSDLIMDALHARDFRIVSWLLFRAFPGFKPFTANYLRNIVEYPLSFDSILAIITEIAAREGRCDVWKWILEIGRFPSSRAMKIVEYSNNIDMISLIPWGSGSILLDAAYEGNSNCIQYAVSEGHALSEVLCTAAACGGQLHTLKFLREIGCPWNHELYTACSNHVNLLLEQDDDDDAYDEARCIQRCMTYALESGCPEAAPVPEG